MVNSIITSNETWIYYYDLTISQGKIWVFDEQSTKSRKSRSVRKKVMVFLFRKHGIIIKRVMLEYQNTVT